MRRIKLRNFALAVLFASVSSGTEVHISGSTEAAFNGGQQQCPATVSTLTITCNTFDVTTNGGVATIPSLAAFTSGGASPFSSTLTFYLIFDTPSGITTGQTAIYDAQVTGQAIADGGNISVVWQNAMQSFTFNDGTTAGVFDITLNNMTIGAQQTAYLVGTVDFVPAEAPEVPSSLMLATGVGLVFYEKVSRWRRTAKHSHTLQRFRSRSFSSARP